MELPRKSPMEFLLLAEKADVSGDKDAGLGYEQRLWS